MRDCELLSVVDIRERNAAPLGSGIDDPQSLDRESIVGRCIFFAEIERAQRSAVYIGPQPGQHFLIDRAIAAAHEGPSLCLRDLFLLIIDLTWDFFGEEKKMTSCRCV
jgi:hypothetical protein